MFNNQINYFNKHPRKLTKKQRKKVYDFVDNLSHTERVNTTHLYINEMLKFEETGKLDGSLAETPSIKGWIEETGSLPFLWGNVTKVLYNFLQERDLAPYVSILQTVSYWCIDQILVNTAKENLKESHIGDEGIVIYKDMLTKLVKQYFEIEGSWYDLNGDKLSLKKAIGQTMQSSA